MIVKIGASGKSFSGLATYLTHDPKSKTSDRVAWSHTLNTANDHVPSAVDEMLWTARHAELLKQQAGVRAGGRATEDSVKSLSLNWAPDERPTSEHMIETAEDFLKHMKWHEHQAVLVAHDDKEYSHVHIMLNMVHPETGLRLNDDFERRRAQAWALGYEKENGLYCEQRLKDAQEREDGPTRPAWMAFQEKKKEFERDEKSLENQSPINVNFSKIDLKSEEWQILKEIQKTERQEFFAEGKIALSELRKSVYREVREEFREDWSEYFDAARAGGDRDVLKAMKSEILAEQKSVLEARRDEACKLLREERNGDYRELLDDQKQARLDLRQRQAEGLDSTILLDMERERLGSVRNFAAEFRDAAGEVTRVQKEKEPIGITKPYEPDRTTYSSDNDAHMKSASDIGVDVVGGAGLFVVDILGGIADGLTGSRLPPPKPVQREEPRPNPFDEFVEQVHARQRNEQEEADRKWRQNQRSYGE